MTDLPPDDSSPVELTEDQAELARRLKDFLIEFGLRKLEASTDTHVFVVRESHLLEEAFPHLVSTSREIDY